MRIRANSSLPYSMFVGLCITFLVSIQPLQGEQYRKNGNSHEFLPLERVLEVISKASGYTFIYNASLTDVTRNVYCPSEWLEGEAARNPEQVLNSVLAHSGLSWEIRGRQIILVGAFSSRFTVCGQVSDDAHQPLAGVTVSSQDLANPVITDSNGYFSFETENPLRILFSCLGYSNQSYFCEQGDTLDIQLQPLTRNLDEVVVVGYTTQRKADLTGAVASVRMVPLADALYPDINRVLQGRIAGVTIYANGGAPGVAASVRIRGLGTTGNNNPLYVLDGMPVDNIHDLNLTNLERVDLLKDAASAAIYGSRAANGVILLRTRHHDESEKIRVRFHTRQGLKWSDRRISLLDARERNEIHSEAYRNSGKEVPAYYESPYAQVTRTNWGDVILRTPAYSSATDLDISGASEHGSYNLVTGYLSDNGILPGSGYDRMNVQLHCETKPTPRITVGERLHYSYSKQDLLPTDSQTGIIHSALRFQPDIPVYDEWGGFSGSGDLGADLMNPVSMIHRADMRQIRNRILGNIYAEYLFSPALKVHLELGYDALVWQYKKFTCKVPESGRPSSTNELLQTDSKSHRWISTNTLEYNRTRPGYTFLGLAGMSYERSAEQRTRARGSGFISEDPSCRYFSAATSIDELVTRREEWKLASGFFRADLQVRNRYLFSANLRIDGSSRFTSENRWGTFPSFSAAWRISDESFFQPLLPVIDYLKVRVSYGLLGNQLIFDNYPTFAKISNTTDNDGYQSVFGKEEHAETGRYESSIANRNIKWEITRHFDVGLDMRLRRSLDVTLDYFYKRTSDLLTQVPMTSLSGVTEWPWMNAGVVLNQGFECTLHYTGRYRDLRWEISAGGGTLNNRVLSLGKGQAIYTSQYQATNITRTIAGEPVAHFFGYKTLGLFTSEEEVKNYVNREGMRYQPYAQPGDIRFADINGDGKIDGADRTNIGDGFPDFTYHLQLKGAFRNLDFACLLTGVEGMQLFNAVKFDGLFVNPMYNQFSRILDRWTPQNPQTNVPRVSVDDKNGNSRMSDFFVEDGDYLRCKELTVGYHIPESLTKRLHVEKLRFYMTAQNLFTLTRYSGSDPEIGEPDASEVDYYRISELGVDRGCYPLARTFLLGIQLTF